MTIAAAVALLVAMQASPSGMAVTIIGDSPARACYLAALHQSKGLDEIATCDVALGRGLGNQDTVATYVNRGILRALRGDSAGAIADYDAAIAIDQDEAEAWLNKGLTMVRSGASSAQALPMLDAAVAKGTKKPAIALYARALVHEQAGNVRAAYNDLVRARALEPEWEAPARELQRYKVRPRS